MKEYQIRITDNDRVNFEWTRNFILQDITQHHTIENLSQRTGINTFKLKVGFKRLYGDTIYGFLEKQRMKRGVDLLINTKDSITTIAPVCGFSHPTNFIATFRRHFHMTPVEYRAAYEARKAKTPSVSYCAPTKVNVVYPLRVLNTK